MLGFWVGYISRVFLMTSLVVGFALSAEAQIHSAPPVVTSIQDPQCLATLAGQCVLRTGHRTIELNASQAGQVWISLFTATEAGTIEKIDFGVDDDILIRSEQGRMTPDEANLISSELANFDGVRYELPPFSILQRDLGFPENTEFALSEEDYRDLVRAHLQISLGVGPVTAAYLTERMGVERVVKPETEITLRVLNSQGDETEKERPVTN